MRLTLLLLCCLVQSVTWAGDLPKPVGKPILTISGNIENTNENGKAVFDLASLETKFEGVPMSKLMDYVGAKGTNVNVIALNDYSTIIPLSDFKKYNAILALKVNGEYMRIRDKGPSFIVYPYDSLPELNNQIYYSRSAWQVSKMKIE